MYKFSRTEIIEQLIVEERTKDNNFWFPFFWNFAKKKGKKKDLNYIYSRDMFIHQMFFTPREVAMFLETNVENFDISQILWLKNRNRKFYLVNKELKHLSIYNTVNGQFSLEELIDCFNFLNP